MDLESFKRGGRILTGVLAATLFVRDLFERRRRPVPRRSKRSRTAMVSATKTSKNCGEVTGLGGI